MQLGPPENSFFIYDMAYWEVDYGAFQANIGVIESQPAGDDATSYFIAPYELHGDWRSYSRLIFEKRSWGGTYYGPDEYGAHGDVIIRNGDMSARLDIPQDHTQNWQRYTIALDGRGWTLSGGANSLSDVLANVTSLQIRAEYGGGDDYSSLARVTRE